MVRSPGKTDVTLLEVVPDQLAGDLGIAAADNVVGKVLSLPYRDALALFQGGYARPGSAADDAGDSDDEGGRVQVVLAPGGAVAANAVINGAAIEARGASHARILAGTSAAGSVAIEQSIDGQSWLRPAAASAIAAGGSVLVEQAVAGRFVRGVLLGGAAAGTGQAQLVLAD